jgi:hypothetical protein
MMSLEEPNELEKKIGSARAGSYLKAGFVVYVSLSPSLYL